MEAVSLVESEIADLTVQSLKYRSRHSIQNNKKLKAKKGEKFRIRDHVNLIVVI